MATPPTTICVQCARKSLRGRCVIRRGVRSRRSAALEHAHRNPNYGVDGQQLLSAIVRPRTSNAVIAGCRIQEEDRRRRRLRSPVTTQSHSRERPLTSTSSRVLTDSERERRLHSRGWFHRSKMGHQSYERVLQAWMNNRRNSRFSCSSSDAPLAVRPALRSCRSISLGTLPVRSFATRSESILEIAIAT